MMPWLEGPRAPTPFEDVVAFHRAMRLVVRARPTVLPPEDWTRRVRLILEELAEVAEAQAAGDLPAFADGIADLVWVALGTGVEAGLPFDRIWAEVRRANMAKAGGTLDASGKLLKPAGWTPPDVAGVLRDAVAVSSADALSPRAVDDARGVDPLAGASAAAGASPPRWRAGTKVGRTLYRDGVLVGLMDTPELAARVAEAMNLFGKCPCCGRWPCACARDEEARA